MSTITDYELWSIGLKKFEDTWWGKKIKEYEAKVDSGEFGEVVKKEWKSDGWCDGVKVPHYDVDRDGCAVQIKVTESGVFELLVGGGYGKADKVKEV